MLLDSLFDPFLEKRPLCVMARATLENLLNPDQIDQLFHRVAERQYQQELLFSSVVDLMGEVIFEVQPSVHAAYQMRDEPIGVSITALYNKLNRIETGVSAELVRDSAGRAGAVIDALGARCKPWISGYRCRVLDGNHLSASEHRLVPLRTTWAAPLPGKVLAVLDPERMVVCDVFLTEDGHAQERSLLDDVIQTIQRDDLWIADRNFCTIKFLFAIADASARFLIRQHGQLEGELSGKRKYIGRVETGKVYEQTLLVTAAATGKQRYIRRITIELDEPTRDGDTQLHLLTNVPKSKAKGTRLAELYRKRWTIETAFQEITETLACEIKALAYPPAALFAFCLALVAYNTVAVLKASMRAAHGEKRASSLSGYYLTLEIRQTYDGMMIAIPSKHWKVFENLTPKQMATWLKSTASHLKLSRYRKHPRGPKKTPPEKDQYKNGGHVSTARMLQQQEVSC